MPHKKLIETEMPVSKINSESEREKTAIKCTYLVDKNTYGCFEKYTICFAYR